MTFMRRGTTALALVVVFSSAVSASMGACGVSETPSEVHGDAGSDSPGFDSSVVTSTTLPPADAAGVPYVDFEINHVLITGQSNSVANGGNPSLSHDQPYANLMFDTGVMSMTGGFVDPNDHTLGPKDSCDSEGCTTFEEPTTFVPLVDSDHYYDYDVETCTSGFANEISFLATGAYQGRVPGLPGHHDVLASLHGRSGNTYQCLRKGGCNYKPDYFLAFDQGLKEVTKAKAIAASMHKSYVVRAVAAIHGESDHYSYGTNTQEFPLDGTDGTPKSIADYSDGVVEWQRDYETEIRKITGQTEPIPLFISQISGWNDVVTSKVAEWQLDAHTKAQGKVFLIGPMYSLPIASDCLHYSNEGERRLGEYFAKVYARVVFEGKAWEPVRPKTITLKGATITATFFVPAPPLVVDTNQVAEIDHLGFTFDDGAGTNISDAQLTGPDTVTITLSQTPPEGADKRLRYAMNQTPGTCIGSKEGARGNLRDSDTTPSHSGYPLENWMVHFDLPVR
jgi:hypothetical protein